MPPDDALWREQAAEVRVAALRATDPASRHVFQQIALGYDRLADYVARSELGAIPGVSFGPDGIAVLRQAFDEAWNLLAPGVGSDPQEIEQARVQLAKAVMAVADEGSRVPSALRDAALQALALRRI